MQQGDAAIELVLMLRLVVHLALRQAEGFAASIFRLLGQELRVPGRWCIEPSGAGAGGPAAAEPLRSRACRSSTMPRAVTASRSPAIASRTGRPTRLA